METKNNDFHVVCCKRFYQQMGVQSLKATLTEAAQWPELALHWLTDMQVWRLEEIAAPCDDLWRVWTNQISQAAYFLWCVQAPCSRTKDF